MRTIKLPGKRVLYPLLFIILSGIIVFNLVRYFTPTDPYRVIAYPVSGGWGYQISHKGKVFIDQPFIPLIVGKQPFPNKKSALQTGTLVLERLKIKQLPVLEKEDLWKMGLDTTLKPAN